MLLHKTKIFCNRKLDYSKCIYLLVSGVIIKLRNTVYNMHVREVQL